MYCCETQKCLMLRVRRPTGFMFVLNFGCSLSTQKPSTSKHSNAASAIRTNMAPTFKWVPPRLLLLPRSSIRPLSDRFLSNPIRYNFNNFVGKFWFHFGLLNLLQSNLAYSSRGLSESFSQVPLNLGNLVLLSVHFAIHNSLTLIRVYYISVSV